MTERRSAAFWCAARPRALQALALLSLALPPSIWGQTHTAPAVAPASQASAATDGDWKQLSPRQKKALQPLSSRWGELTALQKNKWLALSKNFEQLSPQEQQTLHARMSEWVALSPLERNRARLNFNSVQNLPREDVKAKWDEYQALTPEQRRQLASGVYVPAKSAAPANKPTPAERLVQPPSRPAPGSGQTKAPSGIDRNTLLPLPPAAPVIEPTTITAPESPAGNPATDASPS